MYVLVGMDMMLHLLLDLVGMFLSVEMGQLDNLFDTSKTVFEDPILKQCSRIKCP